MESVSESKFCDRCGESLTPLLTIHQSKSCSATGCGKTIYFQKWAENGGIILEAGNQLHIPAGTIKLSLDPEHGYLSQAGLLGFIRDLFKGPNLPDENQPFVDFLKEQEMNLDEELSQLEWINHLDLNNTEHVQQSIEILEKESNYYKFKLLQSSCYGEAYRLFEKNDFDGALRSTYTAHIFHCLATTHLEHFEKIMMLGYDCHHDLTTNKNSFGNSKKEKYLLEQLAGQLQAIDDLHLHVWLTDGKPINNRIHVKGIEEDTLKRALEFEQQRRKTIIEENKTKKDFTIRSADLKTKIFIALLPIISAICTYFLGVK